jgi:hypothetical protein
VGAPCKGDADCGPNQECRFEMNQAADLALKATGVKCGADTECCSGSCSKTTKTCDPGNCTVMFRNGYCTISGCEFSATLKHAACPAGSEVTLKRACSMAILAE